MNLVQSVSIENLVNQRQGVIDRIRQAVELLAEAEILAKEANVGFPRLVIDQQYSMRDASEALTGDCSHRPKAMDSMMKIVDVEAWNYLLNGSGLLTFMDSQARDEWSKQLRKGDVPELTFDNIRDSFGELYAKRCEMFERGVINCFRRLSWDYKTHSPFKFGKRIILNGFIHDGYPNNRTAHELDDLIRVFTVMEGKPEPDHRNGMFYQISAVRTGFTHEMENEHMHLRWFKNGNGHITFKRPDLVEKLNRIIIKHYPNALPNDRR